MHPTSVTQRLIQFACDLSPDAIPDEIQRKLKLHLIDAAGCGWAAYQSSAAQLAHAAAEALSPYGNGQVFGAAHRCTPPVAAFANAMIINGLDHDDGVEIEGKGLGHPGATLVAAAMAAIDHSPRPVPGPVLLTALTAGFEINNRLIHALQPSAARFEQVYGIAQHQAVGAAIVYGRILGFDPHTLHHAVGLAATLANVPSLHKYNWRTRPLVTLKDGVASAAQAGVQAACLAQAGFVGSLDVLDGPDGYWRMAGSDRFDAGLLTLGLGDDWYVRYGSIKRYPACRWLACALECLEAAIDETDWQPGEISAIEVQTFSRLVQDLMDPAPVNALDAQFSLPYTMAAVVLRRPRGAAWYDEATWHDPMLRVVMRTVHAAVDPEIDARMRGPGRQPGARVTVHHRSGATVVQERQMPLGSAIRPMREQDVLDKAIANVTGRVPDPARWIEATLGHAWGQDGWSSSMKLLGA